MTFDGMMLTSGDDVLISKLRRPRDCAGGA